MQVCGLLLVSLQTVARQASLSTEFSRQEYWSGLPFLSEEELSNPGIEPWFPALQADSLPFELPFVPALQLPIPGVLLSPMNLDSSYLQFSSRWQ